MYVFKLVLKVSSVGLK